MYEKLIFQEISKFLIENNLMSSKQSGFKSNDSSINQLLSMTHSLREKCPNTELFLVRIFLYSDWIQENTDQKKLRIWILLTQCQKVFLTNISEKDTKHGDSCPEVFWKVDFLKNLERLTGKHVCRGLFFNKVAGWISAA